MGLGRLTDTWLTGHVSSPQGGPDKMFALKEVNSGAPLGEVEAPGDDVLELLERDSDMEVGGERGTLCNFPHSAYNLILRTVENLYKQGKGCRDFGAAGACRKMRAPGSTCLTVRVAAGAHCTSGLLAGAQRT